MRNPPPDVVASWPAPNYTNPETRGPALIIVDLLAVSISTICLGLRLYVRARIVRSVGWDDWLMVGAALFGVGLTICIVLASSRYGWDIHIWDLTSAKIVASRQVSFAAQALFILATALAKISIFASYLRLAPPDTWFRHLSIFGIWATALANFSIFVALFSECRPFHSYWNLTVYQRDCFDEAPLLLTHTYITPILDFFVWVVPLQSLYHLMLPLSQRIALIMLFSFGLVVISAGCIRSYWVHYVIEETYDVTWYGFQVWLWTPVEVQLGIICGCVPWLKPLFKSRKTGQTVTSGRIHPDGQRGTRFTQVTVVRMGSLRKAWTGEGPSIGEYIDLERSSAGGDSHTQLRFSNTS